MPSVPATMIGVSELGSTRRKSSPPGDSPSARDAVTKSCSRIVSTDARMMRAKIGMATSAMASWALMRPLPSDGHDRDRQDEGGNTSSTSMERMIRVSDLPAMKPATAPSREPISDRDARR